MLLRRGGVQEISIWDDSIQAYLAAAYTPRFDINGDPLLYHDALNTPEADKWKLAMDEEIESLTKAHKVWRLVELPKGRTAIKCRWRFVTKRDTDNCPVRYKARLVAKGFAQIFGIDYDETFTPVARLDTIRMLLAIAAVFTKIIDADSIVIVVVYVDDISIFASSPSLIAEFKAQIVTAYKFSDVGEITQFLGLRILRDRKTRTISIDQQHYIEKIIERFDLENAHPKRTPMTLSMKLTASARTAADPTIQKQYQSMVGSLMYAMLGSRPDICFAVNKLAQYGSNPDEEHLAAAQRIFQYLKATRDYRLTYNGNTGSELIGWCDADWASDPDTRRSTTGYVFQIGSGSVAWATRKQRTVALSSTESEYMALTESLQHAIWTAQILKNLDFDLDLPISIKSDSKGARDLAKNNVFHKLSKHIEIRYHYIREKIQDGFVVLNEVKSADNVADIFTKALPEPAHQRHVRALGLFGTSDEGEY